MFSTRCGVILRSLPALLLASICLVACGSASTGARPAAAGTLSRPAAGGGADVLTREQIERIHATTMEQLITRRFNGLQVVDSDGEKQLVIRGRSRPLIVVDGAPNMPMSAFWQLDPDDIQEIRVLRDSATAIYGIDGANGVIVVSTRKL